MNTNKMSKSIRDETSRGDESVKLIILMSLKLHKHITDGRSN